VDDSRSLPTSLLPNSGPPTHLPYFALSGDDRDALLVKLIFAARRLAQVSIEYEFDPSENYTRRCTGCGASVPARSQMELPPWLSRRCASGEVLAILDALMALPEANTVPSAEDLDRVAEEQHAAAATARLQGGQDFGEPWEIDPADAATLCDRRGLEVYSGMGTGLRLEDEARYAERIRVCVNACEGVDLLDAAGGMVPRGAGLMVGEQVHCCAGITPSDLQFIAARKFSATEISSTAAAPAVANYEYPEAAK
jgi:endogenous inhibitor of DNA gyrase (YacG/DUF329 family)